MLNLSVLIASTALLGAPPENVLLDFTATWCGPCQEMSPIVAQLQRQGYPVRKVDIDHEPALARKYGVQNIPTFVLVANGREVRRVVGKTSESQLRGLLALLPAAPAADSSSAAQPVQLAEAAENRRGADARPSASRQPFSFLSSAKDRFASGGSPAETSAGSREPVIRANHDSAELPRDERPRVDPLAASVRLRIRDVEGASFGSGTVIDSRPGRTVVLTCGHIFRNLPPETQLEVDVFQGERHETYVGKVFHFDLEADVGLCTIPTDSPLPIARLADATAPLQPGEAVYSIGCSAGRAPTRQTLNVTALNRYLGPDNVECSIAPEQGRSGGGLFNRAGELIGVCVAADRRENRGLYAGIQALRDVIAAAGLTAPGVSPASEAAGATVADSGAADSSSRETAASSHSAPAGRVESGLQAATAGPGDPARGSEAEASAEFVAPETLVREAEVVCIIRPLSNPRAASRVVIINRASAKFLSYLADELEQQPQPTMHTVRFEKPAESAGGPGGPRAAPADARTLPALSRYRRDPQSRE